MLFVIGATIGVLIVVSICRGQAGQGWITADPSRLLRQATGY